MKDRCSDQAIVLRHVDFGEADRIVSFFTLEHGLVKGFVRGARKSRRRFGTALESFAQVTLYWRPARNDGLMSVQEADLIDLRTGLRSDLSAIALAGYGCELVEVSHGEQQSHSHVFHLLKSFLDHLNSEGGSTGARLLFEMRLLDLAGYLPHLLHCSDCGGPLGEKRVAFDVSRGGALCPACASAAAPRVEVGTLGTLSRCLKTPLTLFDGFRFGPRTLHEGGGILDAALRFHLSGRLRSRSFLDQLAEEPNPPRT